nr:hypothetical protein [uncultured Acetatifactor sp.]
MQGHARRLEQQYSEGLPGDDLRCKMGIAGGESNQDMGGFHSRIDTKDIGKVTNGECYLLERNDNHAIILFSEYDDQKIEKLQLEIQKIQEEKVVSKVIWFRDGEGVLEETVL